MSIIEKAFNKAKDEGQKLNTPTDSSNTIKKGFAEPDGLQNTSIPIVSPVASKDNGNCSVSEEIVQINWTQLAELGFVTPGDSDTQTIEEYRSIKRPLVSNAFGEGSVGIDRSNLILITSSVPGEGKTFTAINLALSIATERDKKVLLIDADLARPSVSKTLGIKSSPGLVEYLEGQDVEFSDIVLQTNMPGLRIIPAGKQHRHSTELLASNRMILLAQELSNRYPDRIVIFDSPPLLAATQAEVLASLVGQVVLVIEAETTSQSLVMESVNKLASCDVVLAILNKSNTTSDASYYGYGQYTHG